MKSTIQQYALDANHQWGHLSYLQIPGLYWINVDRKEDAVYLCKQAIAALPTTAQAAFICCADSPKHLLADVTHMLIKKLPLFSIPERKEALSCWVSDMKRVLRPHARCYFLVTPSTLWQQFAPEQLNEWFSDVNHWLKEDNSTLLLLSHGPGAHTVKDKLLATHRNIYGLSHLEWVEGGWRYSVSWWMISSGLVANQNVTLTQRKNEWQIQEDSTEDTEPFLSVDTAFIYAEKNILDGIPPQSKNWQIFESNEDVAAHAEDANAATVVFALYNDNEVDALAKLVYALRKQCGPHLKIVVREMNLRLRISNQRLLVASGANLIVPYSVTISKFLMMLDCIQGQLFQRKLPHNIDEWLHAMLPLLYNGYLPPAEFVAALKSRMNNTLLPENDKGLLIIMRPNTHINAQQALSICNLKRMGDIATIVNNQLILFLSDCVLNDLEITFTFIFRLPVDDIFLSYEVFSNDLDILNIMKKMKMSHAEALPDEFVEVVIEEDVETAPQKIRRQPVDLTLSMPHATVKSRRKTTKAPPKKAKNKE